MMQLYVKASTSLANFRDRLSRDDSGASLVEYSVLIGLITVATIAMIILVGGKVLAAWTALNAAMPAAPAP